jgi:hypothetical protein
MNTKLSYFLMLIATLFSVELTHAQDKLIYKYTGQTIDLLVKEMV